MFHRAVSVGRVFLQARDQAVGKKGGSRLWSPALAYSAEDLERELAEKLTSSGEEEAEPVTKETGEGVGKALSDHGHPVPADTSDLCDQLTVLDTTYSVGDVVYLSSR